MVAATCLPFKYYKGLPLSAAAHTAHESDATAMARFTAAHPVLVQEKYGVFSMTRRARRKKMQRPAAVAQNGNGAKKIRWYIH